MDIREEIWKDIENKCKYIKEKTIVKFTDMALKELEDADTKEHVVRSDPDYAGVVKISDWNSIYGWNTISVYWLEGVKNRGRFRNILRM